MDLPHCLALVCLKHDWLVIYCMGKDFQRSSYQIVFSYALNASFSRGIETTVWVLQPHWSETRKLTWTLPPQPPIWADPPSLSPLRCLPHLRWQSQCRSTDQAAPGPGHCLLPGSHAFPGGLLNLSSALYSCHSPDLAFDPCPLLRLDSLPSLQIPPVPGLLYSWPPDVLFHTSTPFS